MDKLIFETKVFQRDDRGGVAIIFAASLVILMIMIGLAVDNARYQNVASRMQQALDGASLAAAKLLADPDLPDSVIEERAKAYFAAARETFGVELKSASPLAITIDRAASSVQVKGKVEVPSYFGGFTGLSSIRVLNQESKVVYDITNVELAMVLDITGSMNSKNKLNDLKTAAKDVIDTLFDGALSDGNIRIALAPYAAAVNAGSLANVVSVLPASTSCYKPCWYCSEVCTDAAGTLSDTCVLERTGGSAYTDAAPSGAAKLPNVSSLASTPSEYSCPAPNVVPLADRTHRDDLKNAIDSYSADGRTAGHIGIAWGLYLLSPNWTDVLPAESAPRPYDKSVQKTMIVMTDGEFNTAYTGASDQAAESYAYFDNLCATAKANDINIYTVGFDLNAPEALAHLESCATTPAQFYDAKTGAQLKDAFKDIANKLGNLRVAG